MADALLKVLDVAVSKQILNSLDRTVAWALATHYADGQPMITATLLVLPHGSDVSEIVASWPFYSTPESPSSAGYAGDLDTRAADARSIRR